MQDANQFVKDVERSSRRIRLVHPEANMTKEEIVSFFALLFLRAALECDLLGVPYIQSRWRRYVLSLREIDVKAYFEDWKKAEAFYMEGFRTGTCVSPCFKRTVVPSLTYKGTVTMFPLETCGIAAARQWLTFDSRYQIGSVDRTKTLTAEYVEDESLLRTFAYQADEEALIINEWFWDWQPTTFLPKHGPGATTLTSRRDPKVLKWNNLIIDKELIQLCKEHNWDMRSIFPHSRNRRYLRSYSPVRFNNEADWRYCDIVFVPKSATTNRVISKEPPVLQYMQQGCARQLVDHLRTVPTWRVNLQRQDLSRDLAVIGSYNGSYATIDCSKASDYVTISLLRELFRHQPDILRMLEATRSRAARLPDGTMQPLEKFAPMGSALAFPIECTVFACICEGCIRRISGRKSKPGDYQVYGDDIVVRTEYAPAVIERLQQLHFLVNTTKSFYHADSRFREACGVEAFCGFDITPVRVSRMMKILPVQRDGRLYRTSHDDPRTYVAWVDFANRLILGGLPLTRKMLLFLLKEDPAYATTFRVDISDSRRYDPPAMPFMIVPDATATQYRCRFRWNRNLHRCEVNASVARNRKQRISQFDDSMELFQWFIDREHEKRDASLEPIALDLQRIPDIQIVREWIPI